MTPTERAKRSDALYYETVSVNRRVLCDMVANREADLEDARAESEHMRLKALAVMGELQEENERLKADNDRLRGLLARVDRARRDLCDAYPDAEMLDCEECPAWDACKGDLADRMRELRVEGDA